MTVIRVARPSAQTYLVHLIGQGLVDQRDAGVELWGYRSTGLYHDRRLKG